MPVSRLTRYGKVSKYVETAEILREGRSAMSQRFHRTRIHLLLLRSLIAMAQMATMRQIQTHQAIMRSHDCLVYLQVRRAPTQALDVDAPLLWVEAECFQGSGLAHQLNGVDVLIAAIVAGAWVAFGVLVGHGRTQSVKDGPRRDIFGSDEDDGFSLALDLEFLNAQRQPFSPAQAVRESHEP